MNVEIDGNLDLWMQNEIPLDGVFEWVNIQRIVERKST